MNSYRFMSYTPDQKIENLRDRMSTIEKNNTQIIKDIKEKTNSLAPDQKDKINKIIKSYIDYIFKKQTSYINAIIVIGLGFLLGIWGYLNATIDPRISIWVGFFSCVSVSSFVIYWLIEMVLNEIDHYKAMIKYPGDIIKIMEALKKTTPFRIYIFWAMLSISIPTLLLSFGLLLYELCRLLIS